MKKYILLLTSYFLFSLSLNSFSVIETKERRKKEGKITAPKRPAQLNFNILNKQPEDHYSKIKKAIKAQKTKEVRRLCRQYRLSKTQSVENDDTLLHYAVKVRSSIDIVRVLLSCGVDPTIKNSDNLKASQLQKATPEIKQVLEEAEEAKVHQDLQRLNINP